jgi:tetratricopeptide (TPR) repeat protein
MLVTLSIASFAIGSMVGFLFTSYGEESGTVGKIRDWLIGGISGVTFAQIIDRESALKRVLASFMTDGANDYALVVSAAITYAILGFFFMFLQRELILNVVLAKSRAERGMMDGTQQAGIVMQRFLVALPPSLLSGADDIDEILTFRKEEAENLRTLLYSEEMQTFFEQAEGAAKSGLPLDWDVVSKVANLAYYRIYFEKEEGKYSQAQCAYSWISRGLFMNALHVDLTVKCADTLHMMDRDDEAVAILEKLERTPDAPAYVKQWLGFFLLNVQGRLDDAIRYSEEYHRLFPEESDSIFNIAYAFAEKYDAELFGSGKKDDPQSTNRSMALSKLKEALHDQPEYAETVRTKWTREGEGFCRLVHDKEFRAIVGLPEETPAGETKHDASS